jgi:hypothetical protein
MNGDIGLYEAWVVDPNSEFFFKGKRHVQGKRRTCIHRMIVAAFSDKSAESLARFAAYRKLKKHPNDVYVVEFPSRVEDLGQYAIPNSDLEDFKKKCGLASERKDGDDA